MSKTFLSAEMYWIWRCLSGLCFSTNDAAPIRQRDGTRNHDSIGISPTVVESQQVPLKGSLVQSLTHLFIGCFTGLFLYSPKPAHTTHRTPSPSTDPRLPSSNPANIFDQPWAIKISTLPKKMSVPCLVESVLRIPQELRDVVYSHFWDEETVHALPLLQVLESGGISTKIPQIADKKFVGEQIAAEQWIGYTTTHSILPSILPRVFRSSSATTSSVLACMLEHVLFTD